MPTAEIALSELAENSPLCVEREGSKVLLIRSGENVFAYEDKCPHAFWPLSQGTITGAVLECPGHGWEFDVQTGRCLTSPAYCLKSVPVTIEGDKLTLQWEEKSANGNCAAASAAHT
jgi:nitrite reductase/ring-hydroxylating ferredoxin subunit